MAGSFIEEMTLHARRAHMEIYMRQVSVIIQTAVISAEHHLDDLVKDFYFNSMKLVPISRHIKNLEIKPY